MTAVTMAVSSISVLTAACQRPGHAASTFTVRDSAGVTIVENGPHPDSAFATWRLDDTPTFRVGGQSDEDTTSFDGVSGGILNSSGEPIVADDGSTLRRFDPRGRLLSASGREGTGPGEYERISLLHRYRSDSLFVWDFPIRRLSVLSERGRFARSTNGPPGFFFAAGALSTGEFIGLEATDLELQGKTPGPLPTPTLLLSFDAASGRTDTIATLPGSRSYLVPGPSLEEVAIPFSPAPVADARDSMVFVSFGPGFEIHELNGQGKVKLIVRWAVPGRPLRREAKQEYVQHLLDRARSDRARADIARIYDEIPFPETFPAISQLLVDPKGNLWVAAFTAAGDDSTNWSIFSPTGRRIAALSTPISFQVLDITTTQILGLSRDSLGVESIQVFPIRHSAAPGHS